MADDESGTPLSRRVPGAARPGPGQPAKPVLSQSVLKRMRAAIDAEQAQAEPEHLGTVPRYQDPGDPNTEPLPKMTQPGSPGYRRGRRAPSPSGAGPDTSEPRAEEPLRPPRALRAVEPEPLAAVEPEPLAAAVPEPLRAAVPEPLRAAVPEPLRRAVPEPLRAVEPEPLAVEPEPLRVVAPEPLRAVALEPLAAVEPEPLRAVEPPQSAPPARTLVSETQPTPGSVGWLWPEEPTKPGGGGSRWRPPGRWRYRAATLITLAAGVALGAGLFIGLALHSTPVAGSGHGKPSPTASAAASPSTAPSPAASALAGSDAGLTTDITQAGEWIAQQVAGGTMVGCDAQTCSMLAALGLPASQQVQIGPNSQSVLSAGIVVVTPVLQGLFDTNPSLGNYVAPTVLASFGGVSIQPVDSAGAAAYQAALSQDVQARIQVGEQLLNSGYISASGTAESELAAGEVDPRVLLALRALANQEPIDVLAFGDSGPGASQGVPFRGVQLAEFDPNALVSRQAYLQVIQQVLDAQATFPAYQKAGPETLSDGETVVQIEWAAPSPFGLLNSQQG
jgi:hypothetical protein